MEKRSGLSELSVIACMSAVEESPLSVVPLYWVPSVTSRWFLNLQSNSHDTLKHGTTVLGSQCYVKVVPKLTE